MITTTLQLDDEIYRRLENEARQRGLETPELLQLLVTSILGARNTKPATMPIAQTEAAFRAHLCAAPLEDIEWTSAGRESKAAYRTVTEPMLEDRTLGGDAVALHRLVASHYLTDWVDDEAFLERPAARSATLRSNSRRLADCKDDGMCRSRATTLPGIGRS